MRDQLPQYSPSKQHIRSGATLCKEQDVATDPPSASPDPGQTRIFLQDERHIVRQRLRSQRWMPGTAGFMSNADPSLSEKGDTVSLPMLKNIRHQRVVSVPVVQSELSGAASNAAIIGMGNIFGSILKFGSNLLLQACFGTASYGLYSIALSLVLLMSSIFNLGLDDTATRYIAIYQSRLQIKALRGVTIFTSTVSGSAGLLGAVILLCLAPAIASIKHEPGLETLLQLMAPIVPLLCMQAVWLGILQGLQAFAWRVIAERIVPALALILLLGMALLFYHDNNSMALATFISTLAGTIISLYYLVCVFARFVRQEDEQYEIREWLSFAMLNFLTSITEIVLEAVDIVLLALLLVPDAQVGQYNAAVKLSDFIAMPLFSLNTMFAPKIAELHSQGERARLAAMFKIVTKWTIIFSLPIYCLVTLFSYHLLRLSGASFAEAWPLLVVSAPGAMISAATGSVGYMLLMTGYQKISLLNSLLAVLLNIALALVLVPRYGAMGMAIATTAVMGFINVIRVLQVWLLLKIQPYRWDVLKPIAAACISVVLVGGLLLILQHANLLVFFLLMPVFLTSYVGLLLLFKASPEDTFVVDTLRRKFLRSKK